MAPEIVLSSNYDHKVDIFSFGIVMYEVISRLFPYGKFGFQQAIELKVANDPNFRPKTKMFEKKYPKLVELMKNCWQESPKDRIQSFGEIKTVLISSK